MAENTKAFAVNRIVGCPDCRPLEPVIVGGVIAFIVAIVAFCASSVQPKGDTSLVAWLDAEVPSALSIPDGQLRREYVHSARDTLARYVGNPGSSITAQGSARDTVLARIAGLSDSRVLEEHAKVLCVLGQGSEAFRSLKTQLAIAGASPAPGDPSPNLVALRLAQVLFTQGRFLQVQRLLQKVLRAEALHQFSPPQWWGHLQLRLALLWSEEVAREHDLALARASADLLEKLCRGLSLYASPGSRLGGACLGPRGAFNVQPPSAVALDLLHRDGYVLWQRPLPDESIRFLKEHYLALFAHEVPGQDVGNDARQRRHGWHNEPAAAFFHYAVAAALRSVLGVPIVPTYTFSIIYLGGGRLYPHLDRKDNEVSLTLSLGSEPPRYIWPVLMGGNSFELLPGEGVLYKGSEVQHARDGELPSGLLSLQVIFGFRKQSEETCHLV